MAQSDCAVPEPILAAEPAADQIQSLDRDKDAPDPPRINGHVAEAQVLEAEPQPTPPRKVEEEQEDLGRQGSRGGMDDFVKLERESRQQLQPLQPLPEAAKSAASRPSRRSRNVVPGLPRTLTFKRQQSELRDNLEPVAPTTAERRALSADRRVVPNPPSYYDDPDAADPRASAPEFFTALGMSDSEDMALPNGLLGAKMMLQELDHLGMPFSDLGSNEDEDEDRGFPGGIPPPVEDAPGSGDLESLTDSEYLAVVRDELEHKWILNLSMHFRDKSKREKFFVTYRETPSQWRRVTISVDYRSAPPGSLEMDLLDIKFQRDKMAKIYEAIRESIQDIKFYDTATNLKLMTTEGRLHVHVLEDSNEIITYPATRMFQHIDCRRVKESELEFDCHMSGFVYKVRVDGQTFIKKEIPSPENVEEFVYEVNALSQLRRSPHIIDFCGIVVDEEEACVKALLLSYAEQGGLVDFIYDSDHSLPWHTREMWARQVVSGLADLHEFGFVQGDFTLSNIVIDGDGNAQIIDLNRRGCPVGWEPPECTPFLESNIRITMYIGVKSDLYQLGMVLWGLAMQEDEPERHPRPLVLPPGLAIPRWYRQIVEICLSEDPRRRVEAVHLLSMFPGDSAVDLPESGRHYDDGLNHRGTPVQDMPVPSIEVEEASLEQDLHGDNEEGEEGKEVSATLGNEQAVVRTMEPPNEWAYVKWKSGRRDIERGRDHTYVDDPGPGSDGEPYYYPTRGRSPPSSYYRGKGGGRGIEGYMGPCDSNASRTRPSYWSDNYSDDATTAPSVSDGHLSREPPLRVMSADGYLSRREKTLGGEGDDEQDAATPKTNLEPFTPVGPRMLGEALVMGEEVGYAEMADGEQQQLVAEALLEQDMKAGGTGDGSIAESIGHTGEGPDSAGKPELSMERDMHASDSEEGKMEPDATPLPSISPPNASGRTGAACCHVHILSPNDAGQSLELETANHEGTTAPKPNDTLQVPAERKGQGTPAEDVAGHVAGLHQAASSGLVASFGPSPPGCAVNERPPELTGVQAARGTLETRELLRDMDLNDPGPKALREELNGVEVSATETGAAMALEAAAAKA